MYVNFMLVIHIIKYSVFNLSKYISQQEYLGPSIMSFLRVMGTCFA